MNYLKLFESYSISKFQFNDRLVTRLNWDAFLMLTREKVNENIDKINENDVKFIRDIVSKLDKRINTNFSKNIKNGIFGPGIVCKRSYTDTFDSVISFDGVDDGDHLEFYKFIDEWWLVEASIKRNPSVIYFLCDGCDGLLEFATKIRVIGPQGAFDGYGDLGREGVIVRNFESYSQDKPNDHWTELDQDEWSDFMDLRKLYFTEEEVEYIRKLTSELDSIEETDSGEPVEKYPNGWDITTNYDDDISNIHFYVHDISYVTLYKLDDEWFGITESWGMNQETFYKCDQWDGLIETLKYIFEHA